MQGYLVKKEDIERTEGLEKQHFLNDRGKRLNLSLGDMTGLSALGFHIITVNSGDESTEFHKHYHEDEAAYILEGQGIVTIGDQSYEISAGDFIGYRAKDLAHSMTNTGTGILKAIIVGNRMDHDVVDYPNKGKRMFRNAGMQRSLADIDTLTFPVAEKKK